MNLLDKRFNFSGAKIALLKDDQILTILRDDTPTIPYPNTWDLPGGGREGDETPFECIQREVFEELGIAISKESIGWIKAYSGLIDLTKDSVFMVGEISQAQIDKIVFGDEGQGWKMMPIENFLSDDQVYESLKGRLRDWMSQESKRDKMIDEV
ncbi:NUDIX hydrolase [Streptococcus cuniculi]|uniref:NUDIX domain-containing protein n=1 Tax=Streptococcus cuniculi TaxID=1432788 RepID=A0A4Y9JBH0_9STRE|nr:NUDIX hydrolase [Streptococcus cuniculi]MBF0777890.1 NUDIX hydrolase [Streptococcus cuniculi]TFU98187.1 NUDIX domain-containing protein [Streptococcus cuniculi]